jgi:hypothetical protein
MTLTGIDISYAQGTTPALGGLAYVIVKASQADFVDGKWAQHSAAVRAAGKPLGAYCFGVSGSRAPVATQVATFLKTAKDADFLVLDLEHDGHWPTSMTNAEAQAFIAAVHAAGRKIGLYHSKSGFPLALGQDWNWVAAYDGITPGSIPWKFWQYTSTPIDYDKFNGDAAALATFLQENGTTMTFASNATTKLIDIPNGETLYAEDGKTVLGTTVGFEGGYSPGAPKDAPTLRLFWRSYSAGVYQLVSAAPSKVSDLPTAGLTQAQLDAAVAAQRATDAAALTAAVEAQRIADAKALDAAVLKARQAQYDIDATSAVVAPLAAKLSNQRPA